MMRATTPQTGPTLMAFWSRHKSNCRPVGSIVADARAAMKPNTLSRSRPAKAGGKQESKA